MTNPQPKPPSIEACLEWSQTVRLVSNRVILGAVTRVCLLGAAYPATLLVILAVLEQSRDQLVAAAWVGGALALGLWLAMVLIMMMVYGNKVICRLRLDDEAVSVDYGNRVVDVVRRIGVPLGLLVGGSAGYTAAGSALLARRCEQVPWNHVRAVEWNPARHLVVVSGPLGERAHVWCNADNYETVAGWIRARVDVRPEAAKTGGRWGNLRRAGLVLVAVVLLFIPELPLRIPGVFPLAAGACLLAALATHRARRILAGLGLLILGGGTIASWRIHGVAWTHQLPVIVTVLEIAALVILLGVGLAALRHPADG